MIQDFLIEQENDSVFDMVVDSDKKDFASVEGMETAFNLQLFIDRRITNQEAVDPSKRKGWIGDLETSGTGYLIGSLLHLKAQARATENDKNETGAYAKQALDYFVAIGSAKKVSVVLIGDILQGILYIDGNEINRYNRLWRETNAINA